MTRPRPPPTTARKRFAPVVTRRSPRRFPARCRCATSGRYGRSRSSHTGERTSQRSPRRSSSHASLRAVRREGWFSTPSPGPERRSRWRSATAAAQSVSSSSGVHRACRVAHRQRNIGDRAGAQKAGGMSAWDVALVAGGMERQPYVSRRRAAEVLASLPVREHAIVETLQQLQIASGSHIRRLHFADASTPDAGARLCRRTLTRLTKLRVVARLDRPFSRSLQGRRSTRTTTVKRVFKPAARRAGVPWATPHALRHGLASLMASPRSWPSAAIHRRRSLRTSAMPTAACLRRAHTSTPTQSMPPTSSTTRWWAVPDDLD
jgi:hypothetical protein